MLSKFEAAQKQKVASRFFAPPRRSGQPLDSATRALMESRFGRDFSNVRIHADRDAARSAESMGASAYTAGSDIVFGADAFTRRRLAHELTHVVQQSSGNVSSAASAEADARTNASRVEAGLPARVEAGAAPGMVQCDERKDRKKKKPAEEEKLENEFSMGSTATVKGGEIKNKYAVSGEAVVPLIRGVSFGALSFLPKATVKVEGEKELPFDPTRPRIPGPADITDMGGGVGIRAFELVLPKLEKKGFSLGASAEMNVDFDWRPDKGAVLGAGAKASLDAAYKSPSLLPRRLGEFHVTATVKATATAGVDLDDIRKAKATGALGAGLAFTSRPLRGPGGTMFGLLGDSARLSVGVEERLTGTAETDNDPATKAVDPNLKLGAGGSVNLTGTGKYQPFVRLKYDVDLVVIPKLGDLSQVFSLGVGFRY